MIVSIEHIVVALVAVAALIDRARLKAAVKNAEAKAHAGVVAEIAAIAAKVRAEKAAVIVGAENVSGALVKDAVAHVEADVKAAL